MDSSTKYPVELLRDAKGIYGIGVANYAETEAKPESIILRPDMLIQAPDALILGDNVYRQRAVRPAFQKIISGIHRGIFANTSEERHRQLIHHAMLRRAGLEWPSPLTIRWWSGIKEEQLRNRKIYHGLRLGSLSVMNRLIDRATDGAANIEAIKLARRFGFRYRASIYRAAATNSRAKQLIEEFPALGIYLFDNHRPQYLDSCRSEDFCERRAEAIELVMNGARLGRVAELMRIPMALRRVKPAVAHVALATSLASLDPTVTHAFMPDSLPRMKVWLYAVRLAGRVKLPEFIEWTAKNVFEIGNTFDEVGDVIYDVSDWACACHRASCRAIGMHDACHGEEFVTRLFSPDMSLRSVLQLSGKWHEAVANNPTGPHIEFPEPWCESARVGHYEILPIRTSAELFREGYTMHHCVASFASRVGIGHAYIFSFRENNVPVATIELVQDRGLVSLGQVRGRCNVAVPKNIERVIKKWFYGQKGFRLPKIIGLEDNRILLDGIPF